MTILNVFYMLKVFPPRGQIGHSAGPVRVHKPEVDTTGYDYGCKFLHPGISHVGVVTALLEKRMLPFAGI